MWAMDGAFLHIYPFLYIFHFTKPSCDFFMDLHNLFLRYFLFELFVKNQCP